MTASELHARTGSPAEFRILGVRLIPLEVGHLRHLETEECDPVRTPGELGTAVRICSMPASEWLAWRGSRMTPFRLAVWGRALREWDFADKLELWADYLRWHTEMPCIVTKGATRESVLPGYRCVRVRMLRLGYRVSEIDSTPYSDALWDIATDAEMDGRGEARDYTTDDLDKAASEVDWKALIERETIAMKQALKRN